MSPGHPRLSIFGECHARLLGVRQCVFIRVREFCQALIEIQAFASSGAMIIEGQGPKKCRVKALSRAVAERSCTEKLQCLQASLCFIEDSWLGRKELVHTGALSYVAKT